MRDCGHGNIPAPYPPKSHWEYNLYEYHGDSPTRATTSSWPSTPGVKTAEYWADWCQALFYAGTTLYQWNELPELKAAFLSLCSLEEGMKVAVLGKYVEESGLGPAVQSLVRSAGSLTVEEIGSRVISAFRAGSPSGGTQLQWDFDYLDRVPDGSLHRVILFGAASHVADWGRLAAQVGRVLRETRAAGSRRGAAGRQGVPRRHPRGLALRVVHPSGADRPGPDRGRAPRHRPEGAGRRLRAAPRLDAGRSRIRGSTSSTGRKAP